MIFDSDNDRQIRRGSTLESTPAWRALEGHYSSVRGLEMRDLFANDAGRFEAFSLELGPMLFDYSKNRITGDTVDLLVELGDRDCK